VRIVFYTPFVSLSHSNTSGDVVIARNLVDTLVRQGHDVCTLPELSSETALHNLWAAVGVPARLRQLRMVARAFHPDVWLTYYSDSIAPDIPGPLLAHSLGARYILYGAIKRGVSKGPRRPHLAGRFLNRLALHAADRVVVAKQRDLEGFQAYGWLRDKLSLLPPAVSTVEFRRDGERRARMRHALGIGDATVMLLAAARLTYRGGGRKVDSLRFLIDCVGDLKQLAHDVRLVIAGDGKARQELEAYGRPLDDRVTFAGAVPHSDMSALYNAADIFCFPGLREPMGMVYLEAQASGVPVVAFRNGGIPELVLDGETGFLVKRLDRGGFVARLEQLIADPALRGRLGDAGIAHVRADHDLDAWGAALTAVLESSPQRGRGRQAFD
jgi:glycosyltransferase involved in cell wall biosynthesis